jgi:DNA-binding LacI/PurR family transcriptional regulator
MLTTVEQQGFRVGEEAADVLIGMVEGRIPIEKNEKRIVRTRLIIRGTTR